MERCIPKRLSGTKNKYSLKCKNISKKTNTITSISSSHQKRNPKPLPTTNCLIPTRKETMEKVLQFKKPKKKPVIKDDTFVCRLPYPLTIHTLVDIVERMGIEFEGTVLPGLKFIERQIVKKEREE